MNTIFGKPTKAVKKQLNVMWVVFAIAAALIVGLTATFMLLCNRQNYVSMIVGCIVCDVLLGWFLVYFAEVHIFPQRKLLKLASAVTSDCSGVVANVSATTQRVLGADCYAVTVVCNEQERILFLPKLGVLRLEEEQPYTFCVADNIIVAAQQGAIATCEVAND